jgi:hypothetical protein
MSFSRTDWLLIALVWLVCSFGSGAILAWFFRRQYAGLSFHKLWALWTTVLSLVVALLFALGVL